MKFSWIYLLILWPPGTLSAATWYLGPCTGTGDGSASQPFCSVDAAVAVLQPGDTLVILPGEYGQTALRQVAGSAEMPITIRGVDASSVLFHGRCPSYPCDVRPLSWSAELDGLLNLLQCRHLVLQDLTVQNSVNRGLDIQGGDHIQIRGVRVQYSGNSGLHAERVSQLSVEQCVITQANWGFIDYDGVQNFAWDEALSCKGVKNFSIRNNTLYDNVKEGIDIKELSQDGDVSGNHLDRCCSVGIYINEAERVLVEGNTVTDTGRFTVNGAVRDCKQLPVWGPQLDDYFGIGILLATGDLAGLSTGILRDITLVRNEVVRPRADGIETWDQLADSGQQPGRIENVLIYHNTVHGAGFASLRTHQLLSAVVRNNLFSAGQTMLSGDSIEKVAFSHNLWFPVVGPPPPGSANVTVDPQFINGDGGDFSLRPGSPAIDKGMDLGYPFHGLAPDLGARESGVPATCSNRLWIPHIASSSAWSTDLVLDNASKNAISARLHLFGDTTTIQEHNLEPWNRLVLPLNGARAGMIESDSDYLLAKTAYTHTLEGGLAEFSCSGQAAPQLDLVFSHYAAQQLTWMGFALMNTGSSATEVSALAYSPEGVALGQTLLSLPARDRWVGLIEQAFPTLAFQSVARLRFVANQPLTGLQIGGIQGAILLFTPGVTSLEPGTILLPHLATDTGVWQNLLILDNTQAQAMQAKVTLMAQGQPVLDETVEIPAGAQVSYALNDLISSATPPEAGLIETTQAGLIARLSYLTKDAPGRAEFLLGHQAGSWLTLSLPQDGSSSLTWKGFALWNPANVKVEFTLEARDETSPLGAYAMTLEPFQHTTDLVSGLWPAQAHRIRKIHCFADHALTGLNIAGIGLDRLLFTPALFPTQACP